MSAARAVAAPKGPRAGRKPEGKSANSEGKPLTLAEKVLRYLTARERGGRYYKRADRLLDELAAEIAPGQEIVLNEAGRKAVLVDLYADRNVVFKPCGVRRYELKILDA